MKKRLNYPDALPQQRRASFFIQKGDEYMSNQTNPETRQWGSRFGYLMVAAGAAIGLGNIWRFPYLAYEGGGGVFLVVYIIVVVLMGHPMVEMETALGRYSGKDTVTAFPADQ